MSSFCICLAIYAPGDGIYPTTSTWICLLPMASTLDVGQQRLALSYPSTHQAPRFSPPSIIGYKARMVEVISIHTFRTRLIPSAGFRDPEFIRDGGSLSPFFRRFQLHPLPLSANAVGSTLAALGYHAGQTGLLLPYIYWLKLCSTRTLDL